MKRLKNKKNIWIWKPSPFTKTQKLQTSYKSSEDSLKCIESLIIRSFRPDFKDASSDADWNTELVHESQRRSKIQGNLA